MPYPASSHTPTILAAAAGAVAGVASLLWGISYWHRCQQRHEGAASTGATWTPQQVAAWLRDNGVSKASVAACRRYKVDGDTLMRLTAQDLYNMGVPLRDARMILAAIDDVKGTAILLSSASPRFCSSQPSSPSLRTAQPAVPSSVGQFDAAWRALVRTCALPSSDASPVEQQQQLALYTGALLESFQVLTVGEQETALSLVASAEKVAVFPPGGALREARHRLADINVSEDNTALVQAVEEKLKPLHGMLDGFLGFLRSPDLETVAPAEFEELGERVSAQVKRIVQVAEQLPPELRGPLLCKCDGVFEALSSRQCSSPGSSGNEVARKAKLMRALGDILSTLEGPTLRELTPAQRVQALSLLAKRAEAIEAVATGSVSGMPKDAEVLSTVQSLLRILQEAIRASTLEAEDDVQVAADEDRQEGDAQAAEGDDATGGPIPVIIRTVQDIQGTLQSEAFQHAPSAVKVELCTTLLQRVAVLEEKLVELPPPAQAMVRDLLLNTKNVLTVVTTMAETVRDDGGRGSLAGNEVQEGEQASDSDADAAEAEKANEGRVNGGNIDAHVEQLEKIFDFLTSDALEQATMEERQKVAAKLLQRVEAIRADLATQDSQGTLITELVGPLEKLLSDMAGDHAASREFLELTAPLSDMRRLLTSKSFQQLPHAERMRMARDFVPQLLQLTSCFPSLSDSERKAAEELVRPINEELLRMMHRRDPCPRSAQGVLDGLQSVMRTIQGAEFTTMLPAARSAWAANTMAELARMRDDCAALGADGEAVLPLIERLRSQLSGLLPNRTHAGGDSGPDNSGESERGGDGANGEVPQEQEGAPADLLWVQLRDMRDELLAAEKAATTVPPERLQKMLHVMGEAVDLPGISAQQGATLQEFGNLLRRQVKEMTDEAKDRSGGAEVDAAEKDCDEAKAALHTFRRSLQALMDMVQDGNSVSATELSAVASKAEELIASANAAKINWREDSWCTRAVRSILEALQQSRGIEEGASRARVSSKVEAVLQSSTASLIANPPTSKEEFGPYMRLLQLAQSSAEQMTNRELMLLKNLQEAVIEAMRRLPELSPPNGAKKGQQAENGAVAGGDSDEESRVEAVLGALQQMSYKLREGFFSAEELDEFEQVQQDLERLLADEGIEVVDAMEAVRAQIRMHRDRLESGEAEDEEEVEEAGNEGVGADGSQSEAEPAEKDALDPRQQESADAFNEDDDDGVGSNGATAASGLSSGFLQHTADSDAIHDECRPHNRASASC
ncbi:hypothetical protein GH5_03834 [Leishmania sp. Ghana 2012 LV757]|uniref:hypothetical protein n=1 Tax=Leishmania sp. Ghana 2012 LV757 TaxID=2803181 RepID=UPI001B42F2E0|nr:hypothetical protein GH5_03834 [Leishmania sp. Ghana 2012 LV757]